MDAAMTSVLGPQTCTRAKSARRWRARHTRSGAPRRGVPSKCVEHAITQMKQSLRNLVECGCVASVGIEMGVDRKPVMSRNAWSRAGTAFGREPEQKLP